MEEEEKGISDSPQGGSRGIVTGNLKSGFGGKKREGTVVGPPQLGQKAQVLDEAPEFDEVRRVPLETYLIGLDFSFCN